MKTLLIHSLIPYYIGPLYNDGNASHNAWVFRKESGKVYPWNFEQKIDVKASSEEFIRRLVRRYTYLTSENVLPKSSLLYQKFMVLNELNNLKINGVPIDTELKQDIYSDSSVTLTISTVIVIINASTG